MSEGIHTVSDLIKRVSAETNVPIAVMCGDDVSQEAIEARMMVAWLGARVRWGHKLIGVSLNRDAEKVRQLARVGNKRWCRDQAWGRVANRILLELRGGGRPPPPPAPPTKAPEEPTRSKSGNNSRNGPPIADCENWGFASHRLGREYLAEQNAAFAKAMKKAGYRETAA